MLHVNHLILSILIVTLLSGCVDYLVVTTSEYADSPALTKLLNYRTIHDGFICGVVAVDGADPTITKSIISNYYSNGVRYVLLIGDNVLPYQGYTDNYYACMDGDPYPDLAIGRFPCRNEEELANMVRKTIEYSGIGNVVYARGSSGSTYDEMVKYSKVYLPGVDILYDCNREQLLDDIERGARLLIYGGHGTYTTWEFLSIDDVSSLMNTTYPIVLSVACETGSLGSRGIMAAFMQGKGGAVATIASSTESYSTGILEPFLSSLDRGRLGDILVGMKRKMPMKQTILNKWNMIDSYNLLGDPALDIRMSLDYNSNMAAGKLRYIRMGEFKVGD